MVRTVPRAAADKPAPEEPGPRGNGGVEACRNDASIRPDLLLVQKGCFAGGGFRDLKV